MKPHIKQFLKDLERDDPELYQQCLDGEINEFWVVPAGSNINFIELEKNEKPLHVEEIFYPEIDSKKIIKYYSNGVTNSRVLTPLTLERDGV